MRRITNIFRWQGYEHIYHVPWLRNRIEYSADPARIKEFTQGGSYTRSQLSITMLARFHLSKNSIVVSSDEYAKFLRQRHLRCMPDKNQFDDIAKQLVSSMVFSRLEAENGIDCHLAGRAMQETYLSLLSNLLGVRILKPLESYIKGVTLRPRKRLIHIDGLIYAFFLHFPWLSPVYRLAEYVVSPKEFYIKNVAGKLERMIFDFSIPRKGGWYSELLKYKANGDISNAQFKGELTSILVSAYTLSSALSTMLLCLAARKEYIEKIRNDENMAKYFILEVLRLYPPFRQYGYEKKNIWKTSRKDRPNTTDFMVAVYGLHRNSKVWPDPELFSPERFINSNQGISGSCSYLPFGIGSRSCIGRTYSMRLMIATLKHVCAIENDIHLSLPDDFKGDKTGLPIGSSGSLISFPVDDRIRFYRL